MKIQIYKTYIPYQILTPNFFPEDSLPVNVNKYFYHNEQVLSPVWEKNN